MVDSGIIDVVVGIFFVFLVFSLVVSGVNDAITRLLAWRSRHLWRTLRQLLDGEGKKLVEDQRPKKSEAAGESWTSKLYAHPLIRQLEGRIWRRSRLRYIPPADFSRALLDLLVPGSTGPITLDEVRQRAEKLDEPLKAPMLAITNESRSIEELTKGIGDWFDSRMEALSTSYTLHAKWALLVVGLVVALAFNIDAVGAAQRLYRDEALRTAVAQQAVAVVSNCEGADDVPECTRVQVERVDAAIRLPVGWPDPDGIGGLQFLGWLIAGIALGQGAPFWFDLLRKAGRLRG